MDENKIFNEIKKDLVKIENQLSDRNGSGRLWENLRTKYTLILPEIVKTVKVSAKLGSFETGFDYRSELRQLKTALLTWVMINEDELEFNGNYVNNQSKDLLNGSISNTAEEGIKNLIIESKIYINKDSYSEKKIALDKVWDAFERLKTIEDSNKKIFTEAIISKVSNTDEIQDLIKSEFKELTTIGNSYSIRHSEIKQSMLPDSHVIEYLYFRMLSLISLVLNNI